MRILVVEDEPNILLLYKRLLQDEGHDVTATTDGEECLQQYLLSLQEKRGYDVIILDYRIPKMDGRAVALKILQHEPTQNIVIVTAYVKELIESSFEIERSVTILQKPFELADLTGLLGRFAEKKKKASNSSASGRY